jgi:transcriptional regulator with XRE-family HTH domain
MHPLRRFRENQTPPLNQEQLAGLLGVTKATISRWESGERFPDREHWPLIREVTGIGTDELSEWSPPLSPERAEQVRQGVG